jgi:hypothetical protein
MTRVIRVANATGMRTTRGANAEFSLGKPGLLVVLFGRHEVIFKALGRRRLKIMETHRLHRAADRLTVAMKSDVRHIGAAASAEYNARPTGRAFA